MKAAFSSATVLYAAVVCAGSAFADCVRDKVAATLFEPKNISEHVRILASDEFEGRSPASAGERKTIAYLQQQFSKFGLQPGAERGAWTQEVPLRKVELVDPASVRITAGSSSFDLKSHDEVVVTSFAGKPKIGIKEAALVFVGYGVSAPELGWDDFKGVDLRGKIAVFLINDPDFASPTPGKFGGRAMTYYGRWTYKFEEAARRGAAGALIVHETAPAAYGWATVRNSWGVPVFDIVRGDPESSHVAMHGWLHREAALRLFRAAKLDFEQLKVQAQQADFSPRELQGVRLSAQLRLRLTPVLSHNVIAKLPGNQRAQESLIYGAHWDHLGVGKPDSTGDRIYHGAVDNAIGVAGLLEMARVFASGSRTARTIYFVAFTAEEQGLLGAEYYTLHPVSPLERTVALLNVDILGTDGPACDLSLRGKANSSLHDALAAAARAQGRVVTPDTHLEAGYFYRTDQFPFAKTGVPAITPMPGQDLYVGGIEAGRKAYDDYIKNRYHQPADRWSPEWDLQGTALDLDVLYRVGLELANSNTWPQWYPGSEFERIRAQSEAARTP